MANTVATLEKALRGYLQQADSELLKEGLDLVTLAMNNARKRAELKHDWTFAEVYAYVTTDSTGNASLSSALLVSDDSAVNLRQVQQYYLYNSTQAKDIPLLHRPKRSFAIKATELNESTARTDFDTRYPGDTPTGGTEVTRPEIAELGDDIEVMPNPTAAVTIRMDAFKWMADYDEVTDTDFFITHGFNYMLFAGLVELNKLTKTFVPQEEGNLPEPKRERDEELDTLIAHDIMKRTRYRQLRKR
jgi:hypothetical protein